MQDNYVSVWTQAKDLARGFAYVAMPIRQAIELQRADVIHFDEYTKEWVGIDRNWQDFTDWRLLIQTPGAFLLNQRRQG